MSNIRNIRKQVAELRRQVHADSIVLTMPDGGTITFPAKEDTTLRLALRAMTRKHHALYGTDAQGKPYELPPSPRLDEAIGLILQAESARWPSLEDDSMPGLLRGFLENASESQSDASGAPGA